MTDSERIEQAERAIGAILAELERDVDMLVESVDVVDVEIMRLDSTRKEFHRRVELKLQRRPGTHWST